MENTLLKKYGRNNPIRRKEQRKLELITFMYKMSIQSIQSTHPHESICRSVLCSIFDDTGFNREHGKGVRIKSVAENVKKIVFE